jgi:hypothetical protein
MQTPEYRYEITTANLRAAVAKAVSIMTELLEEVWSVSNDQPEEQATTDLMEALKRYRDEYLLVEDLSDLNEEATDDPVELVE